MAFSVRLRDAVALVLLQVLLTATAERNTDNPSFFTNGTNGDDSHGHDSGEHEEIRFELFSLHWESVKYPLGTVFWLLFATVIKIDSELTSGFHLSERFTGFIPFSAMEIIFGLIVGGVLLLLKAFEGAALTPTLFFKYLLPPIVFDAGYFMPTRAFFSNIGTILVYAVIGTMWNVVAIGGSLYAMSTFGLFGVETTILDLLLFASIVSAVDPVAVLAVFEEVHVNEALYICVFGESLLNDAVTVVLYHMFHRFVEIGDANIQTVDMIAGGASFFVVSLGGLLVGLLFAFVTAFVTKYTDHVRVVQPLICLLFPYMAYLVAELFHVSGILAIVLCAMVMKRYVRQNITRSSCTTVTYFLKTLTSICETVIFIFLGVSTITHWREHYFDVWFILFTIFFCILYRFIGVFLQTAIMNRFRLIKLSLVDQFIMAYGGLRGAVGYGMVASLVGAGSHFELPPGRMYLTTTVVVILFTVFVMGTTIKPLVSLLKVRRKVEHEANMTEKIFQNLTDHIMAGVEEVSGRRGLYTLHNIFNKLNEKFLDKWFVCESRRSKGRGTLVGKLTSLKMKDLKTKEDVSSPESAETAVSTSVTPTHILRTNLSEDLMKSVLTDFYNRCVLDATALPKKQRFYDVSSFDEDSADGHQLSSKPAANVVAERMMRYARTGTQHERPTSPAKLALLEEDSKNQ